MRKAKALRPRDIMDAIDYYGSELQLNTNVGKHRSIRKVLRDLGVLLELVNGKSINELSGTFSETPGYIRVRVSEAVGRVERVKKLKEKGTL